MIDSAPLVSVVIPTYNRGDLLPLTLKSVLGQTCGDIEVIVVDDGSTDNTEMFMRRITDPRVRYIRNPWSGLPSVNRNVGIRAARGEFVALVDSDDLWMETKLEQQLGYFASHPESNWCFTHFAYVDLEGQVTSRPTPPHFLKGKEYDVGRLLVENFIVSPAPLIRKAFLVDAGMFDEAPLFRFVEDWELWLRLAARARPGFLAEPLALYRVHGGNATRVADPYLVAKRNFSVIHKSVALFPDCYGPFCPEAVSALCLGPVKQLILERRHKEAREMCALARQYSLRTPELALLEWMLRLPDTAIGLGLSLRAAVKSQLKEGT